MRLLALALALVLSGDAVAQTAFAGGGGALDGGGAFGFPPGGYCGDGVIGGSEECDGSNLGATSTCLLAGAYAGTIACSVTCTLDTSGCCGAPPSTSLAVHLDAFDIAGDETWNSGISNGSAVTNWIYKGSIDDYVTQSVAGSKPTYTTNCLDTDKPCVRFDGGDLMTDADVGKYPFMHNGTDTTTYVIYRASEANPDKYMALVATAAMCSSSSDRGSCLFVDDRISVPREDRAVFAVSPTGGFNFVLQGADDTLPTQQWHVLSSKIDDDGGAGADGFMYVNDTLVASATNGAGYSASNPSGGFTVGDVAVSGGDSNFTGDIAQVLVYTAAHDATARGVVQDWAECVYQAFPF